MDEDPRQALQESEVSLHMGVAIRLQTEEEAMSLKIYPTSLSPYPPILSLNSPQSLLLSALPPPAGSQCQASRHLQSGPLLCNT